MFLRFLRRRIRKLVRLMAVIWLPLALACDALMVLLSLTPCLPEYAVRAIAFLAVRLACAAALYVWAGAAAATAATCLCSSHSYFLEGVPVKTLNVEVHFDVCRVDCHEMHSHRPPMR